MVNVYWIFFFVITTAGFISCRDLYKLIMDKEDIIMFDARPEKDYMASRMKCANAINIPEELIEPG